MQSTLGLSIAASTRSVGLLSSEVWSDATTQSSWARSSSATSTSPFAVMFASIPRSTLNGSARVHRLDLAPLGLDPALAEIVRVVGQAEELVAAGSGGERHLLDRRLAVGRPGRVAVHLAPQVAELDESRQRPFRAASSSPPFSRSSGGMKL